MIPVNHQRSVFERIAAGDERAFNEFYHYARPLLHQAAMVYLKDSHIAEEIVQVALIKLWERRATLPELQSPEDYLFILVRNAVFDHFKKVTVETRVLARIYRQAPDSDDPVTNHVQEREDGRIFQQVLSRLPSRQRQVYVLASEHEMSYKEIADRLRVSRLTVKRHLEIARRHIRKNFIRYFFLSPIGPFVFWGSLYIAHFYL